MFNWVSMHHSQLKFMTHLDVCEITLDDYCIIEKFGGELNLAIWTQLPSLIPTSYMV